MASILLSGTPAFLQRFIESIPSEQSIFLAGDELRSVVQTNGTVTTATAEELLEGVDLVCDLDYDTATAAERFASLRRYLAPRSIFIMNSLTMTATDAAARMGGDVPTIGISYIPHLFGESTLLEAAPSLQTPGEGAARGIDALRAITGKEVEVVVDRIGLVSARTLAMIINEAAFALMEGVADPKDIDVAMKLGTNYPEGPLRWADQIGPEIIHAVLQALHDEYQEERYRPCVLLKQLVRARLPFHAPAAA